MFMSSLASLCCLLASLPAVAQKGVTPPQTSDEQIEAVKFAVAKIGTGTKAKVELVRRGKPKVKGFINEIRYDDFDVISTQDGSVGMKVTIDYREVVKLKGKGQAIDWSGAGAKAGLIGLKSLKVMMEVLKGACFGPISRCSP